MASFTQRQPTTSRQLVGNCTFFTLTTGCCQRVSDWSLHLCNSGLRWNFGYCTVVLVVLFSELNNVPMSVSASALPALLLIINIYLYVK